MKRRSTILLLVILSVYLLTSCKRDIPIELLPSISFKTSSTYVSSDSIFPFGKLVKVGIRAGNSQANLTNLIIQLDTGTIIKAFDTSFNTDYFEYDYLVRKSQARSEQWHFVIRDRKGNQAIISLKLNRDFQDSFVPVLSYTGIVLKARFNPDPKSFLSLSDFNTYTLAEAFNKQENMDIFYYYGPDKHTLASPGANVEPDIFTGATPAHKLDFWTTRNTTRYKLFEIPSSAFYALQNDSLLIIGYGTEEGKRKAKNIDSGQVYGFSDKSSRLGMILVREVSGKDSGFIKIDLKIQQK